MLGFGVCGEGVRVRRVLRVQGLGVCGEGIRVRRVVRVLALGLACVVRVLGLGVS